MSCEFVFSGDEFLLYNRLFAIVTFQVLPEAMLRCYAAPPNNLPAMMAQQAGAAGLTELHGSLKTRQVGTTSNNEAI